MKAAPRVLAMLYAVSATLVPVAAIAEDAHSARGFFDSVLETLDVKAKPADPPPEFVTKSRPDASGLDYMHVPLPHKVSPIPTKTPAEVEAMKSALDAARASQLTRAQPVQIMQPKPVTPPTPVVMPKLATPRPPPN